MFVRGCVTRRLVPSAARLGRGDGQRGGRHAARPAHLAHRPEAVRAPVRRPRALPRRALRADRPLQEVRAQPAALPRGGVRRRAPAPRRLAASDPRHRQQLQAGRRREELRVAPPGGEVAKLGGRLTGRGAVCQE